MTPTSTAPPPATTAAPLVTSGLVGLAACWFVFGTGELLYGALDGATDFAQIQAARGRFGLAALLQLLSAVLLAGGVAGLVRVLGRAAPRRTTVGAWLTMAGAVGVGAFAQFHLLLLAMSAPELDREGMNGFLTGPLESGGLWSVPIVLVLLAVPLGLLLLALAAAAAGMSSRWPAVLVAAHIVLHLAVPKPEWGEPASHYVLAVALLWLAVDARRSAAGGVGVS